MSLQKNVFNRLRNKEAHGLANQLLAVMKPFDTTTLGMDELKEEVKQSAEFMGAAQVQVQASIETPAIADANEGRIANHSGLRSCIASYAHRKDENLKTASLLLGKLMKAYGPARQQGSYLALTNSIDNMLADLRGNADYAAAITTLNAEDWVAELEQAQELFLELFDKRVEEQLRNMNDESTNEGRDLIWKALSRTERYLAFQVEFSNNTDYKAMADKWASYTKHITATYMARSGKGEGVVTTEAEGETAPTELEESTV